MPSARSLAFLVVLGVLVVFHELGHYWVARWCRVKVLRFSVGFGRIVWSRRFGPDRTEWALSAVPLGGYVKMVDEREGEVPRERPRRAPSTGRASASGSPSSPPGPIANLLLAVLLFAGTYIAGVPGAARAARGAAAGHAGGGGGHSRRRSRRRRRRRAGAQLAGPALAPAAGVRRARLSARRRAARRRAAARIVSLASLAGADWEGNFMPRSGFAADLGAPVIDEVLPGKPAARAGLRSRRPHRRDRRRAGPLAGRCRRAAPTRKPGAAVTFRIGRDGSQRDVTLVTEVEEQAGRKVGIAGIRLKVDPAVAERLAVTVRYGVVEALVQGARKTWELSAFTLRMLGRILIGDASLKNISGPITMADFAGQSAQAGALVFVGYLALISISLGVLNLLPVPLLDGGHLLYYFAEIIKGSPVSDRAFEVGQRIGMAMLAMLMALALFNDLSRLF